MPLPLGVIITRYLPYYPPKYFSTPVLKDVVSPDSYPPSCILHFSIMFTFWTTSMYGAFIVPVLNFRQYLNYARAFRTLHP